MNNGKYVSLKSDNDYVTEIVKSTKQASEPLLHHLIKIERLLLDSITFLDNCPHREEGWVQNEMNNSLNELKEIQKEISQEVFK
jgi:3-methyladenine DNA glycosylase AlkC